MQPSALWGLQSLVSRLHISTTARASWPDVVVPSMGESIKEGTIAAVLKQVGGPQIGHRWVGACWTRCSCGPWACSHPAGLFTPVAGN